jgi:hypothetical protein
MATLGSSEKEMPYTLIAEFPSSHFKTSLEALEATVKRICAGEFRGRTVLLSGQSYEADGEQYLMHDATYKDETFRFERPIPNLESVARAIGIAPERITGGDGGRSVAIQSASATELVRFLDHVYRVVFEIKLLPRTNSYNFGSEVEASS